MRSRMRKLLIAVIFCLAVTQASDLTDVSAAVFGEDTDILKFLPAAFGDFNSDKLTDFIVLDGGQRTVAVLLASEQSVVPTESHPIFSGSHKNLNCSCPSDCTFESVAPADFDGDGSMDLMAVIKKDDAKSVLIMWGHSDGNSAHLECIKDSVTIPDIDTEPLVFDYNGDSISDLLTVDKDGNRTVFIFSKERPKYDTHLLKSPETGKLKAEHGNAFVDVTGDGAADLVLTSLLGLEIYRADPDAAAGAERFPFLCTVAWPELPDCDVDQCVGQPVFLDFALSGSLDLVLPVCGDPVCADSRLYLVPVTNISACPASWAWEPMSLELGSKRFLPRAPATSPLRLMTPRVGDVDLDGFPDLLMTVYNNSGDATKGGEVQLLLNVACGSMTGCHPNWRQFQLEAAYTAGVGTAVTGAFFDLYEDGKMDLIVINQDQEDKHSYHVSAYVNTTQDSDAYFMKVIVLTGACYHDCPAHDSAYVPYGTNSGGQLVSYRSQRPGPETFDSYQSVAVQLPQTSHFALGLPYTIFGLGMAPNFVDYLSVNITRKTQSWPQIIPNSQLYVIPYPPEEPTGWDLKLMITTSKNIVVTGLAMVGTCALCSVIIVMLHIRERRLDRQAKLQDMKGFHFDAM